MANLKSNVWPRRPELGIHVRILAGSFESGSHTSGSILTTGDCQRNVSRRVSPASLPSLSTLGGGLKFCFPTFWWLSAFSCPRTMFQGLGLWPYHDVFASGPKVDVYAQPRVEGIAGPRNQSLGKLSLELPGGQSGAPRQKGVFVDGSSSGDAP